MLPTNVSNDLPAEHPEIVHVIPNRLLLQSLGDKMDDEWAHRVQYAPSVWHVLLHAGPPMVVEFKDIRLKTLDQ